MAENDRLEIFAAGFAELEKMTTRERAEVFGRMQRDMAIATNKIRAKEGKSQLKIEPLQAYIDAAMRVLEEEDE